MNRSLEQKSSLEEIKNRFDKDVARFSNLETGQSATIDAPLAMELIARAAVKATGSIRRVLDIGCGAGNNTIKLLQYTTPFDCDLVDLSRPIFENQVILDKIEVDYETAAAFQKKSSNENFEQQR